MPDYNAYYQERFLESQVEAGRHRDVIGGLWDEIGSLQLRMMINQGLLPHHQLLDVGCGSLRGGVQFARYLEPDHYRGLDLSEALLDAGYYREVAAAGLQSRLPRSNLIADANFEFSRFGMQFDHAIAISVFTHLPLDVSRICLEKLAAVMNPGGVFLATFFEVPKGQPTYLPFKHEPGGVITTAGTDPFHHRFDDYEHLCSELPWDVSYIGDFGHPRHQMLMSFTRR